MTTVTLLLLSGDSSSNWGARSFQLGEPGRQLVRKDFLIQLVRLLEVGAPCSGLLRRSLTEPCTSATPAGVRSREGYCRNAAGVPRVPGAADTALGAGV